MVLRTEAMAKSRCKPGGTSGRATGYEVGLRSEPLPNLKLEVALFVLNLNSEATFRGDEAVTTPGRPSQRKAIELNASYKPLPWFRLGGANPRPVLDPFRH